MATESSKLAPIIATWLFDSFGTSAAVTGYCVAASLISLTCSAVLLRRPHEAEPDTLTTITASEVAAS